MGDTDQFSPSCIAAFDAGFEAAKARGTNIKALVICNPHNPLGKPVNIDCDRIGGMVVYVTNTISGQCYDRETLVGLLHLCASKGIHLISDEIYALSVFNQEDPQAESFTSVRAIDLTGIIDPGQVHVLYGMSKVSDDRPSPLDPDSDTVTRILRQAECV